MTLDEPAPSPRFQTPQVRKRRPSIVVTPPRLPVIQSSMDASTFCAWRGLPPMLPDSNELDASDDDHNPFERHRPMHSPFAGVSHINATFLSSLEAAQYPQSRRIPRLARRQHTASTTTSSCFQTEFPDLEDEYEQQSQSMAVSAARALKMRRRSQDEYPVFEGCNLK